MTGLCMRTVWSWVFADRKKRILDSHTVYSEGSDLSAQSCGQNWVIAVRARHFVRKVVRRLEYRKTGKGNYSFINVIIDNVRFLPLVNIENAHNFFKDYYHCIIITNTLSQQNDFSLLQLL